MMTRFMKASLGIGLLVAGGSALAREGRKGEPRALPVERLSQALGLSAEQTQRLEAIEERKVKEAIELRGKIAYARHEVRKMLRDEEPDRAKVFAKLDEIARLGADLKKVAIGARLDQRALLSTEQRERFRELAAERRERRHARRRGLRRLPGHDAPEPPEPPEPPGD